MSNRTSKLDGVHPDLVIKIVKVLAEMGRFGFPMLITDGLRTAQEQARLYQQGRTGPGNIVTYADGVIKLSNHQMHGDGFGHAVDCCFLVGGVPSWSDDLPWTVYGATAKNEGLRWGGDWTKPDRPHVELP